MGNTGKPNLKIEYDQETDTLWLGNGLPASNGEDITEYFTVFFDDDDQHNGLMIQHAAGLLLPILTAVKYAADPAPDDAG